MNEKILYMLDDEIEQIKNTMGDLALGSKEYEQAADILAKLLAKRNEMVKIEYDHLDKKQSRQEENDLKLKQMEDEKKDRRVKNGLTAAKIFGGFIVTGLGTYVTLNFERIQNVTTIAGREFVKQLFVPKKD
jgi:hypothetical protein